MTTEGYRNKPQFNYNPALNNDVTPDVPEFNSNAMENDGFVQLDNCSCCNCHNTVKDNKEHKDNHTCHRNSSTSHTHNHNCSCNHKK